MPTSLLGVLFAARIATARDGTGFALITILPFGLDAGLSAAEMHAFAKQLEELAASRGTNGTSFDRNRLR